MDKNDATCRPPLTRAEVGALIGTLALAAGLRFLAAANDLWLDEIWSLALVRAAASPLDLLTKVHHDNNHLLNSWYLYLLGDTSSPIMYRLLSIVSGTASVALLWAVARRRGAAAALVAALLAAVSYPLILYSSEARGYAPAALCGLLGFKLLGEDVREERSGRAIGFWVVAGLGILSHLSFLHVYTALFVWSAVRWFRGGGWPAVAGGAIRFHAVPALGMAALYLVTFRHMIVGGGPIYSMAEVAAQTLAMVFAAPDGEPVRTVVILAGAGLLAGGVLTERRGGDCEGIFMVMVLLLAPLLVVILTRPDVVYFRYFLVCVPFAYLALAQGLARIAAEGTAGRIAAAALIAFFCAGQAHRLVPLLRDGRGRYCDAVRYMAEGTAGSTITVGSDHDFRNGMVLEFHAKCAPPGKAIRYLENGQWPDEGPDWLIAHSQQLDHQPRQALTVPGGRRYVLQRSFRYGGVSGWHWFIYRRE